MIQQRFSTLRFDDKGMTSIEVIVAIVILAIVITVGMALMQNTLSPLSNVSQNIYNSIGADLSVRGFEYQFGNSEIARKIINGTPLIKCTGHLVLEPPLVSQATLLQEDGDSFVLPYAQRRTLGAVGKESGALIVPDITMFKVGMILSISTLNSNGESALFRIESVDVGSNTIKLSEDLGDPPSAIGCTLNKTARITAIVNPSAPKKMAVDVISIVRYQVEKTKGADHGLHLMARTWPVSEHVEDLSSSEIISRFLSMSINESFTPISTGALKGRYQVIVDIKYLNMDVSKALVSGNATRPAAMQYSAGYVMGGIEVANPAAIPAPPNVEQAYVTCMMTGTPMFSQIRDLSGNIVPVYRIDGLYSESETVKNSFPSMSLSVTSTGSTPRCWKYSEIAWEVEDKKVNHPQVKTMGRPAVAFDMGVIGDNSIVDLTRAMVMPVFCNSDGPMQTTSTLKYIDSSHGGILRDVTCSPTSLPSLVKTWAYDGMPSKCKRDGSLFIGHLVNAIDAREAGPILTANECKWTGGYENCNPSSVLRFHPEAELVSVNLVPGNLLIQDSSGVELTCD